jgi:hypothetical protein
MQNVKRTEENSMPRRGAMSLMALLMAAVMIFFIAPSAMAQVSTSCAVTNKAFKSGEKISYNLYFNWKFVWVKAGYATLATNATTYNGAHCYRTDLLSVSSKKVDVFFKMRDTLTSVVTQHLEPLYFRKGAEEGKRYTVDEAWYKYGSNNACHVAQKRTYQDGTFKETSYNDSRCVFDMLSILAQARSWDPTNYAVGQKFNFPMTTGKKVEEQTLIYRGKKNIEADDGNTYRCLVFSFVEYEKKKEKEVITFFVSDDDNHLPIRLDMYLNIGSAKAFIRRAENNRYPLSSIVKTKK